MLRKILNFYKKIVKHSYVKKIAYFSWILVNLYISWCLTQFTFLKVLLWFHSESTSATFHCFHWKKFRWLWALNVLFSLFFAQYLHLHKYNPDQVIYIYFKTDTCYYYKQVIFISLKFNCEHFSFVLHPSFF